MYTQNTSSKSWPVRRLRKTCADCKRHNLSLVRTSNVGHAYRRSQVVQSCCPLATQTITKSAKTGTHGPVLILHHCILYILSRVHNPQECATACTTSMLCCDGRTSHDITWHGSKGYAGKQCKVTTTGTRELYPKLGCVQPCIYHAQHGCYACII